MMSGLKRHSPSSSSAPAPPKRAKLDLKDFFADESNEVPWSNLQTSLADGDDHHRYWIEGQVYIVFFARKDAKRFKIKSSDKQVLAVTISCTGFKAFNVPMGASIRLSLRGARLARAQAHATSSNAAELSLNFSEGATMAIKNTNDVWKLENAEVVDVWESRDVEDEQLRLDAKMSECGEEDEDNWFSSPVYQNDVDDISERCPDVGSDNEKSISASSPVSLPVTPTQDDILANHGSQVSIRDHSNDVNMETAVAARIISHQNLSMHENGPQKGENCIRGCGTDGNKRKKLSKKDRHDLRKNGKDKETPPLSDYDLQPISRAPPLPPHNPHLDLEAGINVDGEIYRKLSDLRTNAFQPVMGVVTRISAPRTARNGDQMVTVNLSDPSRFQDGDALVVTCFARSPRDVFLPHAEIGQVLLLRNVRYSSYESKNKWNGTVYPEKLQWVGYDPATGKQFFTNAHEISDTDFGPLPIPLYKARMGEIEYMVNLGLWWDALNATKIQVGAIEPQYQYPIHCLIGERSYNEFFDCSVEIIRLSYTKSDHDQANADFVFSDYSTCSLLNTSGPYGQWAISSTTSRVPQDKLDLMKEGSYWHLKHVRIKASRSEYTVTDMDLYSAEFTELNPDDQRPYLDDLLQRKAEYLKTHPPLATLNTSPRQSEIDDITAVEDIKTDGHYNLIVQLLYRSHQDANVTDIYVTDYTENERMSNFKPHSFKLKWNDFGLKVLHIAAWGGQSLLNSLELDSEAYYRIDDVKIKEKPLDGLKGDLSFSDKRIKKIGLKMKEHPAFLDFLRRKEAYLAKQAALCEAQNEAKSPAAVVSDMIKHGHQDLVVSTVKDVIEAEDATKFRLIARIKDFYPLHINDFCLKGCTKCRRIIPDRYEACMNCADLDKEYVLWFFRFFLLLEDQEGEDVIVNVSREANTFLTGIDPCDLNDPESSSTLDSLKRRLIACTGNLVHVHDAIERSETLQLVYGPFFDLVVEKAWVKSDDSERVVYSLSSCELQSVD